MSNGSVIYIQITSVGSQQLGILGGNTPQDNLYTSLNNWVGYVYASTPTTYKLTFYSPSSNNPWYGNTNFTANSWQVETVSNIPLNQTVSVHTILTNPNTNVSGVYGLPLNPVNGQQSYIKDINGNANVSPITLVCTSGNIIDISSSNFIINTANDILRLMYYGLTGSNGKWITLGSQLYTNLNSVSNGQTLTYYSSSKNGLIQHHHLE